MQAVRSKVLVQGTTAQVSEQGFQQMRWFPDVVAYDRLTPNPPPPRHPPRELLPACGADVVHRDLYKQISKQINERAKYI